MKASRLPRNPWPLAIVGWFIMFALFIAAYTTWAVRLRDDLVAENYYDTEIRYQQQVDRIDNSQSLKGLKVVTFDAASRQIVVQLPVRQTVGASGTVYLYRPSDARMDRKLPLQLDRGGMQQLDARELPVGLWKVRLQWTVDGREYFLDRPVVVKAG